ncbi:hypothetical protein [Spirulina sp. 06S082]|nr:hypothetical protein [Spirulina sp. 06S082]MEA5468146.1 hypothetical protein [Spirulina sp. 06S082]
MNEKIDGLTGREFVDKDIEQKFIDYHNCVAKLRVISKEENLRLPKK